MVTERETYGANAALYDVAFSWDIGREVEWLRSRLGPGARRILEPACGSGRMFPAFGRRDVDVVGVDCSETMIARARQRMAALGCRPPRILLADMTRFDLGERLDGAICPISSFGYLGSDGEALAHLEPVARHLAPGARYLVQFDLLDTSTSIEHPPSGGDRWEVECDGLILRAAWTALSFDAGRQEQLELTRFEVMAAAGGHEPGEPAVACRWALRDESCPAPLRVGLRAGTVFEERDVFRKWSWEQWMALIERSPFVLAAVHGGDDEHQAVPLGKNVENVDLTWHELVVPP